MKYTLIILVLLGTIGCGNTTNAKDSSENEIRQMLADLKNAPFKDCKYSSLYPGLRIASSPPRNPDDTFDFVCPIDGEKITYYGNEIEEAAWASNYLPYQMENINELVTGKNITFAADLTSFCKKNNPRASILIVNYKNGRVVKTPITHSDMLLLSSFLSGGNQCYCAPRPAMYCEATKSKLARLAEIFGQDINSL
ncbi:MAG: hypothetical protein LBL61_07530 [Elusimicrobiota bacterium]|jgi:hypothetical protein|nr:hypothetical protein [Elusimicrobiota bacterium]